MRFLGPSETERLVRKLQDSELFDADFPKRKRYTHAEWAALEDFQRGQAITPQGVAIKRVKNFRELEETVKQLGNPKHNSAVPILARLWKECAVEPIRAAAGHALREIGIPEARTTLIEFIEDANWFSAHVGARALFDEDPSKFFDRCQLYFSPERIEQPGGEVIPDSILRLFVPGEGTTLHWLDDRLPNCIQQDNRWVDLFVKLRRHKELGFTARQVLEYVDPQSVKESMKTASAKEEKRRPIKAARKGSGDLIKRYRQGHYEEVWKELRTYEAIDGDLTKNFEPF